jgi:AcrR family transcriptional regulator
VGKAPGRTAERILQVALALFNRFGEPNVSTAQLAAELGISQGNLHYHFPAKERLVNALVDRHEEDLAELLDAAGGVRDVEDAWFFLHTLFERIWACRFLYRDLNDLLTRNRTLEARAATLLERKRAALAAMLDGLRAAGCAHIAPGELDTTATSMLVVLTWWLSYEYARDPRHALEDASAQACMLRGARHVLHLLVPYLAQGQREHLLELVSAYDSPAIEQ